MISTLTRLIFWETTAGCNLRCIHCRRIIVADAHLPQGLNTAQALNMVDQISAFSRPILLLSGGDPLFRPDIFRIVYSQHDPTVALATNRTMIDATVADKIRWSGIRRLSVNFDGGCRGHVYGMSNDCLGEEPFCTYQPRQWTPDTSLPQ